jgi:thiamine-phosphate pyrophosphorylase
LAIRRDGGHKAQMPPACHLYLITPPSIDDLAQFARRLERTLSAGDVGALQIRLKGLSDAAITEAVGALLPIARSHDVAVILNDRPDLAAALGCDGVHVGQSDDSVVAARRMVGPGALVGVTCHDSRDLAMAAAEEGADYVAFGAFFPTATKATTHRPDLEILEIWQETMLIPCVAIGGVTVSNCRPLAAAGADFLAVSSGVWGHPDGPEEAVRAFNREIARGLEARVKP